MDQNHQNVFVAEIYVPHQLFTLCTATGLSRCQSGAMTNDDGTTTFISTDAVRQHLGVDYRVSQLSEWFVLEYIQISMVQAILRSRNHSPPMKICAHFEAQILHGQKHVL